MRKQGRFSGDVDVEQIDTERLQQLIDSHGAALALYANQWCNAPEDALQEALIELLRHTNHRLNQRGCDYGKRLFVSKLTHASNALFLTGIGIACMMCIPAHSVVGNHYLPIISVFSVPQSL